VSGRKARAIGCAVVLGIPIAALGALHVLERNFSAHDLNAYLDLQRLDSNGVEIAFWRTGDPSRGRIIYVHGSPGNGGNWEAYLRDPVDGAESIAYDRPGFGETRPREAEPSLERQSAILSSILSLREEPAVLVGHSMGVPIAVRAALDAPARVRGIVLLAGTLDPALERPRWYNRWAAWGPLRALLPESFVVSNDELMPLGSELRDLEARLEGWSVPTAVLHAPDDALVPFDHVRFMRRAFAGRVRVRVLEARGHLLPWNSEAEVREEIARILRIEKGSGFSRSLSAHVDSRRVAP